METEQPIEQRSTKEWLHWMLITSVPLYQLDANDTIPARASGCLVDHGGRRFVLATPHAASRNSTGWVMDLNSRPEGGTEMLRLRAFAYAGEATKGQTPLVRETDFCFSEIPAEVVSMYRFENVRGKFDERPRHVFTVDEWTTPRFGEIYAFAGQSGSEFHADVNAFVTDMEVFPGLTFVKQEAEVVTFQLSVEHPGHERFKGCSGAPIVGRDGRPVALLIGGNTNEGTIDGISLTRYKSLFDFWRATTLAT